jgi:molecular chaperone GrpE
MAFRGSLIRILTRSIVGVRPSQFRSALLSTPSRAFSQDTMKEQAKSESKSKSESTDSSNTEPGSVDEFKKKIKELTDQLSSSVENAEKFKEGYARTLAEQENMRRRLQQEIENEKVYAVARFAKELLDVSDNLDRALQNIPKEMLVENPEGDKKLFKDLYDGVDMTRKILHTTFARFHIVEYSPVDEKFNPQLHDALFTYEDPDKEDGTVGQVMSTGYRIKDRILRPAKVGVIKKKK